MRERRVQEGGVWVRNEEQERTGRSNRYYGVGRLAGAAADPIRNFGHIYFLVLCFCT